MQKICGVPIMPDIQESYNLVALWPQVMDALKTEVTSTVYSTFLQPLKPVAETEDKGKPCLVLEVTNDFFKKVMENTYSARIINKITKLHHHLDEEEEN